MSLDFEPGLSTRFRTLEDCLAHVVHTSRAGVDGVAAHLDMSPSELSRRLNAHLPQREGEPNNRPLRVSDMVGIIEKTRDLRAIHYLVERFTRDPEVVKTQALQQIALLIPMLVAMFEQAGIQVPKVKR
jgi:hypothetical protein